MFNRDLQRELLRLGDYFPVVSIVGPRQSGKTTLCKMTYPDYLYFNLEDVNTYAEAKENMRMFLSKNDGNGMIIDEAQRMPELFSMIQVLVDEDKSRKYILTGSSNFALMPKIKQSLAGRTAIVTLLPFALNEIPDIDKYSVDDLMLKGMYPAVWGDGIPARDVYKAYYNTYIQRDVPELISIRNIAQFQRFLVLLAARVGSEFNANNLCNDIGVSLPTIQEWMNILEMSYVAFRKYPYYKNVGKRLTKTPKVYFYDTGLVCHLLNITDAATLNLHPLRGSIFENLVVTDLIKQAYNRGEDDNIYFYRDKTHEVDLIIEQGLKLRAYEVKVSEYDNTYFYRNLDYLKELLGDGLTNSGVIYTGQQERSDVYNGLLNFKSLKW